jgi:hypothetical protein
MAAIKDQDHVGYQVGREEKRDREALARDDLLSGLRLDDLEEPKTTCRGSSAGCLKNTVSSGRV